MTLDGDTKRKKFKVKIWTAIITAVCGVVAVIPPIISAIRSDSGVSQGGSHNTQIVGNGISLNNTYISMWVSGVKVLFGVPGGSVPGGAGVSKPNGIPIKRNVVAMFSSGMTLSVNYFGDDFVKNPSAAFYVNGNGTGLLRAGQRIEGYGIPQGCYFNVLMFEGGKDSSSQSAVVDYVCKYK